MTGNPLVTVVMITYGHELYIKQAIESILSQQTNDKVELIIADDHSPDDTENIVTGLLNEKKIADNFRVCYTRHHKNKGMMPNFVWALQQAQGKYIALCEGDDYWTDPLKLQKQVEFLEHHPEYVMVFSNANVNIESSEDAANFERGLVRFNESRAYSKLEIWDNWMVPTASVVFRRSALDERYYQLALNPKLIHGDIILFLYLAGKGKLFGLADTTVVYRKHDGGVTNYSKSVDTVKLWYEDVQETIRQLGSDLLTRRKKNLLADLSFDLALNKLSGKKMKSGLSFLFKSLGWSRKPLRKYFRTKLGALS